MLNFKTLAVSATLAIASIGAFAQTAAAPATPKVDAREANQEKRIEQGVASGQLNAKETHRLDKDQAAITKAETKAKADGKVTKHERRKINKMQNAASQDIHAQKHDTQTAK